MSTIQRMWFVPGDGIDRNIITSNIQRYLGNDATVRPGLGTEEPHVNVPGFWIKAPRNLTSSQIQDLQRDSAKYRNSSTQNRRPANDYPPAAPQGYGRPPPGGDSPGGMDIDEPPRRPVGYDNRRPDGYRGEPNYPPAGARPYDEYDNFAPRRPVPPYEMDRDPYRAPRDYDDGRSYAQARPQYDGGRPMYNDSRTGYPGEPPYRQDYPGEPQYKYGPVDPYATEGRMPQRATVPGAAIPPGYNPGPPNAGYPARTAEDAYYPPAGYGAPMNAPMQPPFGTNAYAGPPGQLPREEDRLRYNAGGDYSPNSRDSREGREPARYAYPSPPVTVVGRDNALNTTQPSTYPPTGPGQTAPVYGYDGRPGAQMPVSTFAPQQAPFGSAALAGTNTRARPGQKFPDDMDIEPPRQKARRM